MGVGVGSGICGLITVRDLLGLKTEIIGVCAVSEDAIAEAMRIYFDDAHQVAEGAGATPLAALLQERGSMANENVAVVLGGGNIERKRYLQVLSGVTPPAV